MIMKHPCKMATQSSSSAEKVECIGWAAHDPSGLLSPIRFYRRAPGEEDVLYRITHCGICHTELVWTKNRMGITEYPLVPGHEIAGVVVQVGSKVTRFKVGDRVGTGTYVKSCEKCGPCKSGLQQACDAGFFLTYNGLDDDGTITQGGFSSLMVVHQRYCFKIPDKLPSEYAAPLLCAGITVYSAMVRNGANVEGKSIGIVGLGGLGHLAVKFGKAFGLSVTVLSTSPNKKDEALQVLGADKFIVTSDQSQMESAIRSLDFILDTASGPHPIDLYFPLLRAKGIFIIVGAGEGDIKIRTINLILGLKSISGSAVGGLKETQEMLDFCADKKIFPMVEVVPIQYINKALERLESNDVRYRFVVNIEDSIYKD